MCTRIPAYHLSSVIKTGSYVCEHCAENDHDITSITIDKVFIEFKDLKGKYANAQNEISKLNRNHEESKERFQKKIAEVTTYYDTNAIDCEKSFLEEMEEKNKELCNLRKYKTPNLNSISTQTIQTLPENLTNTGMNNEESTDVESSTTCSTTLEKVVTSKLNEIEKTLIEMIEKKINNVFLNENKTYAEALGQTLNNVTNPPANTQEMKSIIKEARNDELVRERERKSRAANLIVHGVEEVRTENSSTKEYDQEFITSLFRVIGSNTNPLRQSYFQYQKTKIR